MECVAFIKELFILRWGHAFAIIKSWLWIISHINFVIKRYNNIDKIILKNIYKKSIIIRYFLFNIKKYNEL